MSSKVYFMNLRASTTRPFMSKYHELIKTMQKAASLTPGGLTALKLHFGEKGNTAFIRPVLVRPVVELLKNAGLKPFLTDCNTLYVGARLNSVDHSITALENGFAYAVVNAPIIIGDGLNGQAGRPVKLDLPECREAYIGEAILEADNLISLAHFKGHEATGFGGAIKNLGMGCASRQGKLFQHSNMKPVITADKCIGCGHCVSRCAVKAISLQPRPDNNTAKAAVKSDEICIGCAYCLAVCPVGAIHAEMNAQYNELMRRMAAYAKACLMGKEKQTFFVNYLTQVSPYCDCYPFADAPITNDLGIMASLDPVALDRASADMVNQAPKGHNSCLPDDYQPGQDKFKALFPAVDWQEQLRYGEKIGLGSQNYELITIK